MVGLAAIAIAALHWTLEVVPYAHISERTIASVKQAIESKTGLIVVLGRRQSLPAQAYYRPRNRYRAEVILKELAATSKARYTIGLTTSDISTTAHSVYDWGVFGLGACPGRSAVISSFRLGKPGKVSPTERLARVAVHEVGHMLGLPHCPNHCIMADAEGSIKSLDDFPDFCNSCKAKLQKIGGP